MHILFCLHDFQVESLGIAYLSSALKKAGHETALVKTRNMKDVWGMIAGFKPDVFGFSVTTGWHNFYLSKNRELRKYYPHAKSIFGGPHATYMPEMINEEGVDVVMRGECEKSFVDLLTVIESGLNGAKRTIDPYPLEQNLDNIEFPDRELLYSYLENLNNPIFNLMMTRGCVYSLCTYCYASINKDIYTGQRITRWRSPENVIEECEQVIKKYPQKKFVFFQDDEFLFNRDSFIRLMELYKEKIKLPFHCQCRIDTITGNMVKILKESGCISVTFAIESGNENIRNNLLKKRLTDTEIYRGVEILKKSGLKFRSENMIGIPGETVDEALETLDLNISIRPDVAWCSLFSPYPKTELGELSKKLLLWDGDYNRIEKDFFTNCPIKRDRAREFNNLQKIFGLVVEYPILRPLVRGLIKLPEMELMDWVSRKFKHVCYDKRLYEVINGNS